MSPPAARRQPIPPPLAAIVGPTAAGKTDLSLALAQRLPLEILVADSRQVYRGMDIGTAKPHAAARAAAPHHLLDLADPDAAFTVADWVAQARRLVPEIWARGRLPLVVGGTGLYVTALVDGHALASQPGSAEVRRELAAELEAEGLPVLAARLATVDPAAAARTDLRNPRRVLRALERAIASGGASRPPASHPWPGRVALLGVSRPRPVLDARIAERSDRLFANGLLDEAGALAERGYGPEVPALSGHGYREALAVRAGALSLEDAVAITSRHTRQYAKRQMTWFRRDRRIVWLDAGDGPAADLADEAADLVRRLTA
ncbi:MAG TPA: tRNA (adenosine(37)-N6)-dimethylallyltransferase MiaA [Candidatus Limnocylindria bacterium]|nr:tRNA (adenosine(37)-N6)-dimethylallyltransferase MiaA [Candidatus Limnocylindria bacterium]